MISFSIRGANWETDKEQLLAVRHTVFVDEQKVPIELECDASDPAAMHWLASDQHGHAIGTVRMLNGQIGRMAVLKHCRGQGVGQALLSTALTAAKQQDLFEASLSAQTHAVDFYRKQGFEVKGDEFMDAGIAHLRMSRRLSAIRKLALHGGHFSVTDLKSTAIELISQAGRSLKILSCDLNRDVFDNETVSQLISGLARKSRYTEIAILVVDSSQIAKRGHRLLTLQQRLPTSIALRAIPTRSQDVKDNLIIADDIGMICQSIKQPQNIWADFNNRPVASNYSDQFNEWWHMSIDDKNLRQLEI